MHVFAALPEAEAGERVVLCSFTSLQDSRQDRKPLRLGFPHQPCSLKTSLQRLGAGPTEGSERPKPGFYSIICKYLQWGPSVCGTFFLVPGPQGNIGEPRRRVLERGAEKLASPPGWVPDLFWEPEEAAFPLRAPSTWRVGGLSNRKASFQLPPLPPTCWVSLGEVFISLNLSFHV